MATMQSSFSSTNGNYLAYPTGVDDYLGNSRKCYQMQTEPQVLNNSADNYKLKIMEKDKLLFEYSKTQKENEKAIETLRRNLDLKEEENQKLKLQIQDMSFQLKKFENMVTKSGDNLQNFQKKSDQRIKELTEEKENLQKNKEELQKVLESQEINIKNSYIEYQNLQKDYNELKTNLEDKMNIITKYESIFEQLKKDNKQIPSLKRQIVDMESVFSQYKNEINSLKEKNEKLAFEKEDIENKLRINISEQQKDKVNSHNLFKLNYELENLRKDNVLKEKENSSLLDKYKNTLKDSDNFVHLVTSELGQFTNFLESLNLSTKTLMKMPISTIKNFASSDRNSTFSLKFEVILKTIDLLKSKTIEIINSNLISINKLNNSINESESKIKKNITEKDLLEKDNVLLKHKLTEAESLNKDYKNNLDALNESYTKLKDSYIKLKKIYQDFTEKNEKISKETNDFLVTLSNKLYDQNDCENLTSQKIIAHIDILLSENKKLNSEVKELNSKLNEAQKNNLDLKNSNDELQRKLNFAEKDINEKISNIELMKDKELKQQKSMLYEKIKSLTQLLEESNHLIQSYENEVKELKNKITKLEYNLKMLTDSHIELERSINNNTFSLQTAIDEKDLKYNNLLREIELKDLHIQSLEKLINQENPEMPNNIYMNTQNQNSNQSMIGKIMRTQPLVDSMNQENQLGVSNNNTNNTSVFIKNEEHEQELNKLMNCFNEEGRDNQDNSQNPMLISNNKQGDNYANSLGDNNREQETEPPKKIPGKLYFVKKK